MRKMTLGLFLVVILAPPALAQTGKHVAIGAGLTAHKFVDSDFTPQRNPSVSFVYRITLKPGAKEGWSWEPKGGFGWFRANTDLPVGGLETRIGRVRARPIMAGIERAYRQGPMKLGFSAVAGPSFNHFSVADSARVAYRTRLGTDLSSVSVKNSLAVRPEVSLWYDLGPWFALHGSVNYMVDRPTAKTTAGGVTTSERWNTDHVNFQIGLVVGIF